MRKTVPFLRMIQFVQFIRESNKANKFVGNNEISSYLAKITGDEAFIYAPATFSRDKTKIKNELGIDLKYTKSKGYFINYSEQEFLIETSLDYYKMFAIMNQANALPEMFLISERKPLGLNQITEVVDFIKDKKVIQFNYLKYNTNEKDVRIIEPLAIKESLERWYLIGNDHKNNKGLRAFGFDRMSDITFHGKKFAPKFSIEDIQTKYQWLFAMFDDEDKRVEEIELEFDSRDGNYIKSLPIHQSQKVENIPNGVRVYLKLKPTPDFIKEIMSRAWSLKVIKPESLRQEIAEILKDSLLRNQ